MTTTLETQAATHEANFGDGRYSPLMKECYKDIKVIFKLDEVKAEKLAKLIGSDFGAAMRQVQATSSIGKSLSKDGKVTLRDACKVKTTETLPLRVMRALSYAAEAGKNGFLHGKTQWQADDKFIEYFNTL
jgi:hypothetical protein